MPPKLSIIIVPFRCRGKLQITLDAVFASQVDFSYEVIVIDNGSEQDDGTAVMMSAYLAQPHLADILTYIPGPNVGFPKGNNHGLRLARGEYLLLLNPDTKVDPDNLQVMTEFIASHPEVGIATCKLLRPNGELDSACRRNEPSLWVSFARLFGLQALFPKLFGHYNLLGTDINQSSSIGLCSGAYMIFHRRIWEQTQGFDEQFFMYGEDIDLCHRVRKLGYQIWYHPATSCLHYKGQSSRKVPKLALWAFHDAMWRYYQKYYARQYFHLMDPLVWVGNWGLWLAKTIRNAFRAEAIVSK